MIIDRHIAAAGTALIAVASVIYAVLPPDVVLPVAEATLPGTWPGNHLTALQWAGQLGLIGDVALIAGAARMARHGQPWFWAGTALATFMFIGFDYITARVLGVVDDGQMPLVREMMSGLFVLGLVFFALGAFSSPVLPWLSKTGGALVLATACLWLFVPIPPLIFGLWLFAALALIFAVLI